MDKRIGQLATEDIAVGVDLGSEGHHVVVLDAGGRRLTSFRIAHSLLGFEELVRRCTPARLGPHTGRAVVAFEATGHFWEALAHFLTERQVPYALVNPLATFRVREARQMGRDKRDITDAEQIADLLRVGLVTETQLNAPDYVTLRRAWNEYDRLRSERARLKTLLKHELYGVFPELVTVWKDALTPGLLAVLRLGLPPSAIAARSRPEFWQAIQTTRRGRRVWRFKIDQVHDRAGRTVAPPHAQDATMRALQRLVTRVDLLAEQLEHLSIEIQTMLTGFDEARYLATMPGIGWPTVAGVIAEIGPIAHYRHGRQLVKLAGLNPSRRESGKMAGRTMMTRRGRARLRTVVYMATVSSIQHNPRLKAHYERLVQRPTRPLPKMQALGACMTKFLLYAFAVMKTQRAFDVDHRWKGDAAAAA